MVTLFRLAYFEGEIYIDHLDISVLGLHDLRRKISIIPQVYKFVTILSVNVEYGCIF